jgi:demethylspheroidene O-methyltransferase
MVSTAPFSVRERIAQWRERLVASPRFRLFAARFPLTRPVARREARRLFDLVAGFVYSQVLLACVRLGLFERLEAGPRAPEELARDTGLSLAAALRLLEAAAALDLVSRREGGRFGLGSLGAAMLHNPGITAMIEHHGLLYEDLADPVALLREGPGGTRLGRYWAYASAAPEDPLQAAQVAEYTALMSASQTLVAQEVIDAYPFRRHRRLLDVGGGDGTFVSAVAAAAPDLEIGLFDLPAVAGHARRKLAAAGLGARVAVHAGSFTTDPLPRGADIVTLVRVVHDHDDAVVARLFAAVRACLAPGGTLLVAEPMAGGAGTEPMAGAYFGLYLWAMGQGRARRPEELRRMLLDAGFTRIRQRQTHVPLQTCVLVARA